MSTAAHPPRPRPRGGLVLLVLGLALLAVNLRMAVVAVGPLTARIRHDTGLSSASVSLLTTLPLICFGAFAVIAPRMARRIGLERSLLVAIVVLIVGTALRLGGEGLLFAGSAVVGAGIAILNVLLGGLIKRDFPDRVGPMMGMYSVLLSGGATLASGTTVPIGNALGLGWRPSLAVWGIPAVLAALVWLPIALRSRTPPPARGDTEVRRTVWRSRLAWWTAAYMGAQSLVYYGLVAWMATLLQDHGVSVTTSGAMLSVFNFVGIGSGLSVPVLAARMRSQRPLVLVVVVGYAIGLAGLIAVAHGGVAWVWMVVLGVGQGASISLGLTLFVLRTRSAPFAAELSGMAQTVGYLVAALGPVTVGTLHGVTGSWTPSMLELLVVCAVMLGAGWICAAPGFVE